MQKLNESQIKILKLLIEKNGNEIDVAEYSKELGQSLSLVYRNFTLIASFLSRKQGNRKFLNFNDHVDRCMTNSNQKKLVAKHIVKNYIMNGQSLFIDCGTSCAVLSEEIIKENFKNLQIHTNNPISLTDLFLDEVNSFDVFAVGGQMDKKDLAFCGENGFTAIQQMPKLSYVFIGIDRLAFDGSFHIKSRIEVLQKKELFKKGDTVVIILDDSKIGDPIGYNIGSIDEMLKENIKLKIIIGKKKRNEINGINILQKYIDKKIIEIVEG
ncbi:MAG: hypothetical protein ABIF18_00950 [archaeon]